MIKCKNCKKKGKTYAIISKVSLCQDCYNKFKDGNDLEVIKCEKGK